MERLIFGFLLIFLALMSMPIWGCNGLSKQTDLNNCANNVLAKTNEKLNKVYSNYLSDLTPDEQSKLKESQNYGGNLKIKIVHLNLLQLRKVQCILMFYLHV
jgi:uncharacterized protein YecT (DUF1311 family)